MSGPQSRLGREPGVHEMTSDGSQPSVSTSPFTGSSLTQPREHFLKRRRRRVLPQCRHAEHHRDSVISAERNAEQARLVRTEFYRGCCKPDMGLDSGLSAGWPPGPRP
ncbi:hypothetical protein EYF80_016939 [Liparis tanakae]|uniref:Uncharacterized protein n=1 Tax=Liparis tanakae TaxID=230148 RepID=A0A4Z2I4E3_9TELE|nr:hypothetical protein EYF80_016939 [Liparis tanakae]